MLSPHVFALTERNGLSTHLWIDEPGCCTRALADGQTYLRYPGIRRDSFVSAQLFYGCAFRFAHFSGDGTLLLPDASVRGTIIVLRRTYSRDEGPSLLADDRVYCMGRSNDRETHLRRG